VLRDPHRESTLKDFPPTAVPFGETLRAVGIDRFRLGSTSILVGGAVLLAWLLWFFLARVTLHAVTDSARIEVDQAPRRLEATHHSGQVVAVHAQLGKRIRAGEVLIELENDLQRSLLAAEEARHHALTVEVAAVEQQRSAQQKVYEKSQLASESAIAEAEQEHLRAISAAEIARSDAVRKAKLKSQHLVSAREVEEAESLARERDAAREAMAARVERVKEQSLAAYSFDLAELRKTEAKLAHLRGEIEIAARAREAQAHEVEHHELRAPVSGQIAEVRDVQVGSYVQAGAWLATIIPDGGLRVVATYPPGTALGRIRPGQSARMRLDGFPWPQYPPLAATVALVATEPRDGRVRVELAITGEPRRRLPVEHGLPGTLEVDLERISPAELVLRSAGKVASPLRAAPAPEPAFQEAVSPGESGVEAQVPTDPFAGSRRREGIARDEE
jgi:membrane fusion protein (multidrug efflux system)